MSYAKNTSVSVEKSMNHIRMIFKKINADGVAIAESGDIAMVQFVYESKAYKFFIHYPNGNDISIRLTANGKDRTDIQIGIEIEKEKKRLWRAMVLYIKASVEAHENGLINFKKSMLSNMVLPSGSTVYEKVEASIDKIDVNPMLLLS